MQRKGDKFKEKIITYENLDHRIVTVRYCNNSAWCCVTELLYDCYNEHSYTRFNHITLDRVELRKIFNIMKYKKQRINRPITR